MLMERREFMRAGAMGVLAAPLLVRRPAALLAATHPDFLPTIEIIPRSEWAGDLAPVGPLSTEDVRFLLVHHTASGNEYERDDVPALLRGFFEYHTSAEKGWPDIAYNFLIDRFGRVWEGRAGSIDGPVAADATGGNQGYAQLVSMIGNFSIEPPTSEALDSLVSVLAGLAGSYQVDTTPGAVVSFVSRGSNRWAEGTEVETPTIAGHRDMSLTECPGDVLYAYVTSGLADDVSGKLQQVLADDTTTSIATTSTSSSLPATSSSVGTTTLPTLAEQAAPTTPPIEPASGDTEGGLPVAAVGAGLLVGIGAVALAARKARMEQRGSSDGA